MHTNRNTMANISTTKLFYGFSTQNAKGKTQQFADLELVKRDLLNYFNTRVGERVMMPKYGCGIWDLLFDQFDQSTYDNVVYECQKAVATDSRLQLINTSVTPYDHGIQVQMDLLYVPLQVVDTFSFSFDQRSLNQ